MDNDTTSKAQLQEYTGQESTGCMTAELVVIEFYADPLHCKKHTTRGYTI